MKDINLPKLYTSLRDTLLQADWVTTHTNPEDTFVVLVSPDNVLRCVLHYMPECSNVYPDGSWTLKLNTDEGTWQVETATRPICNDTTLFMADFRRLTSISVILKDQISKDPF
jgi:hypothetical protein